MLAPTLLERRSHPLAMVGLGLGTLLVVDLGSVLAGRPPFYPYARVAVLVLVFALFRWGSTPQTSGGWRREKARPFASR